VIGLGGTADLLCLDQCKDQTMLSIFLILHIYWSLILISCFIIIVSVLFYFSIICLLQQPHWQNQSLKKDFAKQHKW